jgi:hypothetical protein
VLRLAADASCTFFDLDENKALATSMVRNVNAFSYLTRVGQRRRDNSSVRHRAIRSSLGLTPMTLARSERLITSLYFSSDIRFHVAFPNCLRNSSGHLDKLAAQLLKLRVFRYSGAGRLLKLVSIHGKLELNCAATTTQSHLVSLL